MKLKNTIKLTFIFLLVLIFSFSILIFPVKAELRAASNGIKVFIDAGHGGRDPGAVRNGLNEKDANIAIALKLKNKLEANGFTVIMRRTGDNYNTLDEIVNIANNSGADIFISIHNNASISPSAHGTETYWNANGVNGSNQLAVYVQSNLVNQIGRANRGVKTANFRVIKYTTMPAALVECAFVSNATEAELLKSADFQDKCATGLFNGIKKFAEGIDKSTGNYTDTTGVNSAGFDVIVDGPNSNATLKNDFLISGWAADLRNMPPKRLAKVEIYNGLERTESNFLGQASIFDRPDLGRQDILKSGYVLKIGIDSLAKGENILYVYAYDAYDNFTYRPVKVNIIKEEAVEEEPNINPTANPGGPYEGTAGEEIAFDGSASSDSDGEIIEYSWDFGDGSTSNEISPLHTYAEAGTYTITLTVKDNDGANSSDVITEAIIAEQVTEEESDDTSQDAQSDSDEGDSEDQTNEEVQDEVLEAVSNSTSVVGYIDITVDQMVKIFENRNSTKVEWATRLAQLYIDNGKLFNIRADIAWAQMIHETGFLEYTGDVGPDQNNFAGIGATGGIPGNSFETEELGVIAHFAHLSWYYYQDHINEYCNNQYDPRHFGSTHYRYTGNITLNHLNGRWAPGSTYTDKIIIYTNEVIQAADSTTDTYEHIVNANAGEDVNANIGDEIIFDASASVVSPLSEAKVITYSWDWDFDGQHDDIVEESVIKHIFNEPGTFEITLKLMAFDNIESTDTVVANINDYPIANPGGPYEGIVGEEIIFNSSASSDSDGEIIEYSWDFGDGNTSNEANPINAYTDAGTYTVSLMVTDDKSADSIEETVIVNIIADDGGEDESIDGQSSEGVNEVENIAPIADPGGSYEGIVGEEIIFDGSASTDEDGEITEYGWDFGDGNTGIGINLTHVYAEAGTYHATLIVKDDDNSSSKSVDFSVIIVEESTDDNSDQASDQSIDEEETQDETQNNESDDTGSEIDYNTGRNIRAFAILIDSHAPGPTLNEDFRLIGWAADLWSNPPKKLNKVEVFNSFNRNASSFLGEADRYKRPDLGRADILDSGFYINIDLDSLDAGNNTLYIFAYDGNGDYSYRSFSVNIIKDTDSSDADNQEQEEYSEAGESSSQTVESETQSQTVMDPISNSTSVVGYIDVTVDQLVKIFTDRNSSKTEWARRLAQLYIDNGKLFNIRADIAWAQMVHETGFLEYTGDVQPNQNNFVGIGATGGGVPGNSFASEELGIIAHYSHLAWYYYPDHVNEYCNNQYDPRHFGSTHYKYTGDTTLNHLNGRWAPGSTYTNKIILFANGIFGY